MYDRGMNTLTHEKRYAVVRCLVDGCSIGATTRMTRVAKNTIRKLTRELGEPPPVLPGRQNLPTIAFCMMEALMRSARSTQRRSANNSRTLRANRL